MAEIEQTILKGLAWDGCTGENVTSGTPAKVLGALSTEGYVVVSLQDLSVVLRQLPSTKKPGIGWSKFSGVTDEERKAAHLATSRLRDAVRIAVVGDGI